MTELGDVRAGMSRELVSGTQALVYGICRQAEVDRHNGHDTAGFVSGYRGSPLGNLDFALWNAQAELERHGIVFRPGLNEDLAATACWGTQQAPLMPDRRHDGVFAFWYGKGPGVDRSMDAIRHGNLAGTSPLGGVVLFAGDDHGAKSSSTAHQSELMFEAAGVPVFNPASVEEYLAMVPAAVALSRFAGVWVGFKCVTEIVEATAIVPADPTFPRFTLPEVERPAGGFHIVNRFAPLACEESLYRYRLPAAQAFLAANGFDRVVIDSPRRTLGIVAPGKAFVDVEEALRLLGIDAGIARRIGLRLFKPMVTWPIAEAAMRDFCEGHDEILVIEEKRDLVERQVVRLLARSPAGSRPVVTGKTTPHGEPLLPDFGELSPPQVALAIGARMTALGLADDGIRAAMGVIGEASRANRPAGPIMRPPMFCSGCPHNRSTRLPDGSQAMGGIGCHGIATIIPELRTSPSVHMGAEGANWIGIAPFAGPDHIFQNMGDGTYAHSGVLAIRAAIAAKSNITYKVLCNSAVAMTGGQPVEGAPDAGQIARQVVAEGADRVILVSEAPERFAGLAGEIDVRHRDDLMAAQEQLRAIRGVTVLVYDQGCAAERRRLRKRGEYPDLPIRTFINPEVCEGCGDCNAKSSCVSVLPIDTEFGVKRTIDQENCNKDYTCVEGFCPSFVTVTGGTPRKIDADADLLAALAAALTDPPVAAPTDDVFNLVLAGIGGTGVISLGATLARAAELDGQSVQTFDVTGVSQKNGSVFSHVRFLGDKDPALYRPRIPRGQLDLLVGCDMIAAASGEIMQMATPGRTRAVINADIVPTAGFQRDPDFDRSIDRFEATFAQSLAPGAAIYESAGRAIGDLIGQGPLLNLYMLGIACQRGLLPLRLSSLEGAIGEGRGGVRNLVAFRLGRLAAQDRAALDALLHLEPVAVPLAQLGFEPLVERARALLTEYQNATYAERYLSFVREIAAKDAGGRFAHAVALNLLKLMRYKDEYEVARLHASPAFARRLRASFEGTFTLQFHLAPPTLTGGQEQPRKRRFGASTMLLFRGLQHFRFLRGTPLDPFGRGADRRLERRLIEDYRGWVSALADRLADVDYETAIAIAALPEMIRGYGHVKHRNVQAALARRDELMATLSGDRRNLADAA